MLNKKSLLIVMGLVVFAAACNGPEDLSTLQGDQQAPPQVEQVDQQSPQEQPDQEAQPDQQAPQGGQNEQAPQGQPADTSNAQLNNTAPQTTTSTNTDVDTNNLAGQFADHVTVTFTNEFMVVETNSLPDHEVDTAGVNTAVAQDRTFYIPLNPQLAGSTTDTPMGQIGIAVSGAVFYNGFTSTGEYAVELEILDHCGGHSDGRGVYHYHEQGDCIHGNLLGYAFDGFEIRGNVENDGSAVSGLDVCNGHTHDSVYHYHATDDPSKPILGCYSGVVETSNIIGGGTGGQLGGAPTGGQGTGTDEQGPALGENTNGTGPQGGDGRGPGGGGGQGPGGGGGGQGPGGGGNG